MQDSTTSENIFAAAPIIACYTRAQAIEDGALVDVTEWASNKTGFIGGFTCPVAVTAAVWADIENIPASKRWQDVRGRAHDVLFMASLAIRGAFNRNEDRALFRVILHLEKSSEQIYKIMAGPGDEGECVITIMQVHED